MKPGQKIYVLWFILMCLGCQHERPWPGSRSERIVVLLPSQIGPLDPRLISDGTTSKVSRLVYRALFSVRGEDLGVTPDLAESLAWVGPRQACVRLKPGQHFHDGRPLRAQDVHFSITSAMDPETRSSVGGLYRDRFLSITMPDGPDGLSVCFHLRKPVATLKTDLVMGIVPAGTDPNVSIDPPGTGTFRVLRRDGDRGIVLERSVLPVQTQKVPRYLVLRNLPDEPSRLLALLARDADVVLNGFSPPVLETLKDHPVLQIKRHPSVTVTYLTMNTTVRELSNGAVRSAIARALDRDWMVKNRLASAGQVANGMLPVGHWARDPSLPPVPHDLAEANRLLDAAGFPRDESGSRFTLDLLTSNDRIRRLMGRDIARFLGSVGITVRVRSLEIGTLLHAVRRGQYSVAMLQLPEAIEPDMMRWMFYSLSSPLEVTPPSPDYPEGSIRSHLEPGLVSLSRSEDPMCRQWAQARLRSGVSNLVEHVISDLPRRGGGNRSFWADAQLDCWLDRGRSTSDMAERKRLYGMIQGQLAQDLPVIFLWHEDNVAVVSRDFRGLQLNLRPDLAFVQKLYRSPAGVP